MNDKPEDFSPERMDEAEVNLTPKKSYNWPTILGLAKFDDLDVVRALNLDDKYAYTPDINHVALEKTVKEAYKSFIDAGNDPAEAELMATKTHKQILASIREAEKRIEKGLV